MTWTERTPEEIAALKEQWERDEREPTPLPWRVVHGLQWDGDPLVSIQGANEDTVADNTDYYPHPIKAADAEVIARAVNAHERLVAIVNDARATFETIRYDLAHDGETMSACRDAIDRIDAALAAVGGDK